MIKCSIKIMFYEQRDYKDEHVEGEWKVKYLLSGKFIFQMV